MSSASVAVPTAALRDAAAAVVAERGVGPIRWCH